MVVGVQPECGDTHHDAVQGLDHAEDQLGLHLLGVKVLIWSEDTKLTCHILGQIVHGVFLVLGQISNVGN